jgi:DUF971 family protein
MRTSAVLVKAINQTDNFTFTIQWTDGLEGIYRLNELQKNCPCAKCTDEITGKRLNEGNVKTDVRALKLMNVGRYALRIQYTSGCSTGIYGFDMLYKMACEKK